MPLLRVYCAPPVCRFPLKMTGWHLKPPLTGHRILQVFAWPALSTPVNSRPSGPLKPCCPNYGHRKISLWTQPRWNFNLMIRADCCPQLIKTEVNQMRTNKLRQLLNAAKPSVGTRVHSTWPSVVEAIGHTGIFDYVEFLAEYA